MTLGVSDEKYFGKDSGNVPARFQTNDTLAVTAVYSKFHDVPFRGCCDRYCELYDDCNMVMSLAVGISIVEPRTKSVLSVKNTHL